MGERSGAAERPAESSDAAGDGTAGARPECQRRLHEVIFEADTPAGFAFDVALLVCIVASVLVVLLASVSEVAAGYGGLLYGLEWAFTLLFTVEYVLRLLSVDRPARYARSFFGVVDLLAILPTWMGLFVHGAESLLVVRLLRMLRVFRVLKLATYLDEARILWIALGRSRRKITVFLTAVLTVVVIMGAVMYVVEGPERGFTSIPVGMYWAIVTLTTVGYGDISPQTPLGQAISSLVMIMGYAIIAVPTGIVSVELAEASRVEGVSRQACPSCAAEGHAADAVYCRYCGEALD